MERGTKATYCERRDSVKSPFSLPSGGRHYAGEGGERSAGQEGPCGHYYSSQQTAECISRSCQSPAQPPLWSGNSRDKAEAGTQSSHIGSGDWMGNDESNRKAAGGRGEAETKSNKVVQWRVSTKGHLTVTGRFSEDPLPPVRTFPEWPINWPCVQRRELFYRHSAARPHPAGPPPLFRGSATQTGRTPLEPRLRELPDRNISQGSEDLKKKAITLSTQVTVLVGMGMKEWISKQSLWDFKEKSGDGDNQQKYPASSCSKASFLSH